MVLQVVVYIVLRAADPARVGGVLYFKSGHLSGFGDRGRHYHADREIPFEKTDHFESFRDHRQDSGRGIFGRGHDADPVGHRRRSGHVCELCAYPKSERHFFADVYGEIPVRRKPAARIFR